MACIALNRVFLILFIIAPLSTARILTAPLSAALVLAAPLASLQGVNPYETDRTAIRVGRALFETRCAQCHGGDAKGISGPDLTVLWAVGTSDDRVFRTIQLGVSGSIMPSSSAPDQEIWAMVAYVKSISTVPEFENDTGDAVRGQEIFASTCANCHRVNGQGGHLGPDLTRIAAIRTREMLMRSIRDPSASVAAGYRAVTLVTRDGQRIRGAMKSEDAFSILMVDTDERLQGYLKADLQELTRGERSLMPEFGPDRLGDEELDDLLRYLGTLRGAAPARR
ncbi:MAG: c-type cytochrome [Gemmatimonadetes bacterium]|nr:c-type cytochrome [Gemmatimonadota bacterium]